MRGLRTQALGRPILNRSEQNTPRDRIILEDCRHLENSSVKGVVEARRHPRYKIEVEVCVYPRNSEVVRGHTVDISESGISAMLRVEVPVGEVVRLAFNLPLGVVEVHALVRQRSAFRFGFQFIESSTAQEIIGRTCRQLSIEQSLQSSPIL